MMDALTEPLINSHEAQIQRRTKAIEVLIAYCSQEETRAGKVAPNAVPPVELGQHSTPVDVMQFIKKTIFVATAGKAGVSRCYVCVAKAESVGPNHPHFAELCHEYARAFTLGTHFIAKHLDALADDASAICPICKFTLIHKKHLQNHSHRMHGVIGHGRDRKIGSRIECR